MNGCSSKCSALLREPSGHRGNSEGGQCRQRGREDERDVVEFLERCPRHDAEEQCRQRHIEQEEVHPRQPVLRQGLGLAAGEPDENQAEIRQCEIENVDHRDGSFSTWLPPLGGLQGPAQQRLIRPFASSIGHNHGLFDEI